MYRLVESFIQLCESRILNLSVRNGPCNREPLPVQNSVNLCLAMTYQVEEALVADNGTSALDAEHGLAFGDALRIKFMSGFLGVMGFKLVGLFKTQLLGNR